MITGETTCPPMWIQEYVDYLMLTNMITNAILSMSVLTKFQRLFLVVMLTLMVLCSIMLLQSVVLVYLVLPMFLTDQSHVLCVQYEFNIIMTDIRLIIHFLFL